MVRPDGASTSSVLRAVTKRRRISTTWTPRRKCEAARPRRFGLARDESALPRNAHRSPRQWFMAVCNEVAHTPARTPPR